MASYTVSIFNEQVISRKFLNQAMRLGDSRAAFGQIADYIAGVTDKRFEAQGPGWLPLTSKWAARKASHGYGVRILQMTGALRKSVTEEGTKGSVRKITKNSLDYGSDLPYSARHQFGYGPTPQRRYLYATSADKRVMRNILGNHFMQPFRATPKAMYMPRFTNLPRR